MFNLNTQKIMTKKDEKLENGVNETVDTVDAVDIENVVTNSEVELSEPINVETLKSTLVRLEVVVLEEEGKEVIAALLKDDRISTKNTTRSYEVALSGPAFCVEFASKMLAEGDLSVVSGAEITWERKTYAPGSIVNVNGESKFFAKGLIIDHILDVNLENIKLTLLKRYMKEEEITDLSPLMEKILLKGFNIDLN